MLVPLLTKKLNEGAAVPPAVCELPGVSSELQAMVANTSNPAKTLLTRFMLPSLNPDRAGSAQLEVQIRRPPAFGALALEKSTVKSRRMGVESQSSTKQGTRRC
jgi:hypothetical protein